MITCPRCGKQAPDGTPWCPYCGYGKPPEQARPNPAQYMGNVSPAPGPEPQKPKRKMVRGCLVLAIICVCVVAIFVMLFIPDKKADPTATPTIAATNTERPSLTPAPSRTPYPTATARPESCNVKGNRNTKIYHCKNSPYYDTTDDFIRWFCSPEEAEAEGYRPPSGVNWCEQ